MKKSVSFGEALDKVRIFTKSPSGLSSLQRASRRASQGVSSGVVELFWGILTLAGFDRGACSLMYWAVNVGLGCDLGCECMF